MKDIIYAVLGGLLLGAVIEAIRWVIRKVVNL